MTRIFGPRGEKWFGLEITRIRITLADDRAGNTKIRAWAAVTLNDAIVIDNIRIIEGRERTFVAMPSKLDRHGGFHDVAYPTKEAAREWFEGTILEAYKRTLEGRSPVALFAGYTS